MSKKKELDVWTPNPAALRTMGIRNPLTAALNNKLTKVKWDEDFKMWLYKVELPCLEGSLVYTYMLPDEMKKELVTYGRLAWKMEHALMTWARERKRLKLKDTIGGLLKACRYLPGKSGYGRLRERARKILLTWKYADLTYNGYMSDKRWEYHLTWVFDFIKSIKLLEKRRKGIGKNSVIGFEVELNKDVCGKPEELQWVTVPSNYLEGLTNFEAYIFNYIYSLQGMAVNRIKVKTLLNIYCFLPDERITKEGNKRIKKWVDEALKKAKERELLWKYDYEKDGNYVQWKIKLWMFVKPVSEIDKLKKDVFNWCKTPRFKTTMKDPELRSRIRNAIKNRGAKEVRESLEWHKNEGKHLKNFWEDVEREIGPVEREVLEDMGKI